MNAKFAVATSRANSLGPISSEEVERRTYADLRGAGRATFLRGRGSGPRRL